MADFDFYLKRGDLLPSFACQLTDDAGDPVDLTGTTVRFVFRRAGSPATLFKRVATITNALLGQVTYDWQSGDTAVLGGYEACWEVEFPGVKPMTFPNDAYLKVKIMGDIG